MFLRIIIGYDLLHCSGKVRVKRGEKEDNVNYHARLQHTFCASAALSVFPPCGALPFFTLIDPLHLPMSEN